MRTVVERERKFESPADFRVPDLTGDGIAALDEPAVLTLDATYYDTPELRLTRGALALRRRTGGNDAGWHLKVGAAGGARTEHQRALTSGANPPRDLMQLVRAAARGAPGRTGGPDRDPPPGVAAARRRQRRAGHPRRRRGGRARPGRRPPDRAGTRSRSSWSTATRTCSTAVERRLRAAGARHRVAGEDPSGARGTARRDVTAIDAGAATPVLAYAAAYRDDLVAHEPAAREGDVDGVHDMRGGGAPPAQHVPQLPRRSGTRPGSRPCAPSSSGSAKSSAGSATRR